MSGDRLRELFDQYADEMTYGYGTKLCMTREAFEAAARALMAEAQPAEPGQLSDGYHTFDELYEHRHALCLALMRAMPGQWWFSRRHADGELCFGKGDWFIVGAELRIGHSITYHLPNRLWEAAQATGATELKQGLCWDGHTAADVVERLKAYAAGGLAEAQPQPVEPTDEDLLSLRSWSSHGHTFDSDLVTYARAVLARWGRPAPEPVSVAGDTAWREFIEAVQHAQHVAAREGESPRFDLVATAFALWRSAAPQEQADG